MTSITTAIRSLGAFRMAVVLSGAALGSVVAQEEEKSTIRTTVNVVLLDAGVWSKDGNQVAGLNKQNFEIHDNGRRRPISNFGLGTTAISFALVIDFSHSMRPRKAGVIEASRHLVNRLAESDEIAVIVFNDDVKVVHPPALAAGLSNSWLIDLENTKPEGRTALRGALVKAASLLSQARHERRVCILLSDGQDTASSVTREEAMNRLQSANVTVFSIGLFRPGDVETDAGFLEKIARESGGEAFFDENAAKLSTLFDGILTDLRARYVLGFVAGDAVAAGRTEVHRLKVIARDDSGRLLRVRARRGYQIGGSE